MVPPPVRSEGRARVCNRCDVQQLSPPTYSVEDDSRGGLYSWKYRVVWPERPKYGKHSFQAEMDIRLQLRKSSADASTSSSSVETSKKMESGVKFGRPASLEHEPLAPMDCSLPIRSFKVYVCPGERQTEYKVRCLTLEQASLDFERFQKRDLLIYYRMPSLIGHRRVINALPMELPLMMACRVSGDDVILHSQIQCYSRKNEDAVDEHLWSAVRLDSQGKMVNDSAGYQLGFTNVLDLLSYYARMTVNCDVSK